MCMHTLIICRRDTTACSKICILLPITISYQFRRLSQNKPPLYDYIFAGSTSCSLDPSPAKSVVSNFPRSSLVDETWVTKQHGVEVSCFSQKWILQRSRGNTRKNSLYFYSKPALWHLGCLWPQLINRVWMVSFLFHWSLFCCVIQMC